MKENKMSLVGRSGVEPLTSNMNFLLPLPLRYLPYCPRSVHTHFQGLCVVFGLLIYIPSARLTEQCCSHLLWLCESAESDLITSVVRVLSRGYVPNLSGTQASLLSEIVAYSRTLLSRSYILIIPHFCGFVKGFLKKV